MLIFWVAQHLTGSALSIIIVCEGFIVFVIAALARVEPVSLKRLAGVAVGFVGIASLILTHGDSALGGGSVWLVVALLVPLNFAFEDLLVAARMPPDIDIGTMIGLSMLVSASLLLGPAWLLGDLVPLTLTAGPFELLVLLLALKSLVGMALFVVLMTSAGAVFGSQVGYVKALAGNRLEHAAAERVDEPSRLAVLRDHRRRTAPGRIARGRRGRHDRGGGSRRRSGCRPPRPTVAPRPVRPKRFRNVRALA